LDYINLYAYVGLEPGNATDPTGMAGCEKGMSQATCDAAMEAQDNARTEVNEAQKMIGGLLRENAEMRAGTRTELSAGAQATKAAAEKVFGSSRDSVLRAVNVQLGRAMTFFNDPGTSAGGRYDFRDMTRAEVQAQAKFSTNDWPLGFVAADSPNTVALSFRFMGLGPEGRGATILHEALHVMGHGTPTRGEQYGSSALALARQRGGTATVLGNNPENYACFVFICE
jgi:hypothetical protein